MFEPTIARLRVGDARATVGGVAHSALSPTPDVQIASGSVLPRKAWQMKPAPFDYQAPSTLPEAVDLLASNLEAFVIPGGQSLMPVLAFRLATPNLLVDLRRLPGLDNIAVGDDGFRLGALVRWR